MRGKGSKLMHIAKAPIRVLCKARDFYVKNMLNFANNSRRFSHGNTGGVVPATQLPKSYSVNYSREDGDEEFRRLLRLFSKRGNEMDSNMQNYRHGNNCSAMRRSYSVGLGKIGRIDEDKSCSFREEDEDNNFNGNLYSRSRSHACI